MFLTLSRASFYCDKHPSSGQNSQVTGIHEEPQHSMFQGISSVSVILIAFMWLITNSLHVSEYN